MLAVQGQIPIHCGSTSHQFSGGGPWPNSRTEALALVRRGDRGGRTPAPDQRPNHRAVSARPGLPTPAPLLARWQGGLPARRCRDPGRSRLGSVAADSGTGRSNVGARRWTCRARSSPGTGRWSTAGAAPQPPLLGGRPAPRPRPGGVPRSLGPRSRRIVPGNVEVIWPHRDHLIWSRSRVQVGSRVDRPTSSLRGFPGI